MPGRGLEGPVFSKKTIASLSSGVNVPELVKNAGIEGTVEVTSRLGESGAGRNPRISKSVHEALDVKVLQSVQSTTFKTTGRVDLTGEKVSVRLEYGNPRA